ncbi:MAG: hypothetical protein JXQ93_08365 [Flavobacteriaceae bacterium]
MTRKEFLVTIWKKAIRPVILVVSLYYSFLFLQNILANENNQRFIFFVIIIIISVNIALYLIQFLLAKTVTYFSNNLPKPAISLLKIIGEIITYLTPVAFAFLIYYAWSKDETLAFIILCFILISEIRRIILENKKR